MPALGYKVLPVGKPVSSLSNPVAALVLLGQPVAERRSRWGKQVHQGGADGTPGVRRRTVSPGPPPWHSLTQHHGITHQSPGDSGNVSWERALSQLFQALN